MAVAGRRRAVDNEVSATDIAGGRTCQEHNRVGNFFRRTQPSDRTAANRCLVCLRRLALPHVPDATFEIYGTGETVLARMPFAPRLVLRLSANGMDSATIAHCNDAHASHVRFHNRRVAA